MRGYVIAISSLSMCILPALAEAQVLNCKPEKDTPSCTVDQIVEIRKVGTAFCQRESVCVPDTSPPSSPTLDCRPRLGALDCEVLPAAEGYSYMLGSGTEIVALNPGPTASTLVVYACGSAGIEETLSITVQNALGLSATGAVLQECPDTAAPQLSGPSGAASGVSFSVSWSVHPEAVRYQLQRSRNGGPWSLRYEGSSLSWTDQGPGGTSEYRVRACSIEGCGSYSSVHTVQIAPSSN